MFRLMRIRLRLRLIRNRKADKKCGFFRSNQAIMAERRDVPPERLYRNGVFRKAICYILNVLR